MAAKCRGQDWSRPPGPHRPREWGIMVRNHHVPPDTSLQTDRFEPGGRPGWDTQPKVAALDTHTLDRIGERLVTSPLTTNPPYEPGGRLQDAARRLGGRPGRRNGPFQPNRETPVEDRGW